MEHIDDIDLLLTLHPHGWSSCFLLVRDKTFELVITHVFGAPYSDLIQALTDLINGQNNVTLFWYGEPGGHRIEINKLTTQQNKVTVSVNEFEGDFDKESKHYSLVTTFDIKLKQLITIFYLQLQKAHFLLRDKQFSDKRAQDFPFQAFHQFEKVAKSFLDM